MRPVCSLACLAACTFSAPKAATDAGPDARPADAREPAWVVVDELTVPVNRATVMSAFVLEAGVRYRLRASGTFVIQSPEGTPGDAEYWDFAGGQPVDGVAGVDVGLAVNDPLVDTNRTPRWGAYDASHVYEVEWTGAGAPIAAQLHDGNYANNTGALKLEILELR